MLGCLTLRVELIPHPWDSIGLVNPDSRGGQVDSTSWWEELQNHTVKGMVRGGGHK